MVRLQASFREPHPAILTCLIPAYFLIKPQELLHVMGRLGHADTVGDFDMASGSYGRREQTDETSCLGRGDV